MNKKIYIEDLDKESEDLINYLEYMSKEKMTELCSIFVLLSLRELMYRKGELKENPSQEDFIEATQFAIALLEIAEGQSRH